jgi:hypothetical protein
MTYDDLVLKVSDRYSELIAEDGICHISILKKEFGLSTSEILEILGIKDILDFDITDLNIVI